MSKVVRRIGYLRFGRLIEPWIESGKFDGLGLSLKKAGMDISLRAYLGMMLFTSFLTFIGGSILITGLSYLLLNILEVGQDVSQLLVLSLFIGIFGSILCVLIEILLFFQTPKARAADRKILMEAGLASTASYLSAMSSSGVPPDRLFYSLAAEETVAVEIARESKRITRDIEIFGYDILKALKVSAERSPSERFGKFLDGMSATITSGGDLTFYLASESKALMKLKEEETKEFIEQLGVFAEIFMILGVVTPLFLIVIIAILSVIAKGAVTVGQMFIVGLTYFLMPFLMITMLLLLSTISREI